jgi:hypothetical protein
VSLAASHPESKAVVELFQSNMRNIAEGLRSFFERYEGRSVDLPRFRHEWAGTVRVLAERMQQEEQTLHPLFRRLESKAA